jgi:hypothetical protein
MKCTTRILGIPWTRHAWRRRVASTETIPTGATDMWGRGLIVQSVRCRTEEVCEACGAVREAGYCMCDTARGEICAVRVAYLANRTDVSTAPASREPAE